MELCSYAIVWWSFLGLVRFFKVDGTWGPEGGISRRMVSKTLSIYNVTKILLFFFFKRLTSPMFYGLPLSTHLFCFRTLSSLICGFSMSLD